jgi:hypothetical protein
MSKELLFTLIKKHKVQFITILSQFHLISKSLFYKIKNNLQLLSHNYSLKVKVKVHKTTIHTFLLGQINKNTLPVCKLSEITP